DLLTAAALTFNATAAADVINVVDGPTRDQVRTTQITSAGTFERLAFANKGQVTVNGLDGPDTFTLHNPNPAAGLHRLTLDGGAANDRFLVVGTSVTTEIDGGDGGDAITVGSGGGTLDHLAAGLTLDGGAGVNSLLLDDGKHRGDVTWAVT